MSILSNRSASNLWVDGIGKVQFRKIGDLTATELNTALKRPTAYEGLSTYELFNEGNTAPAFTDSLGAQKGVNFYRLIYRTTVPETGRKERVSGLLVIPKQSGKQLPMVSWQHGTVVDPKEAPSMLVNHDQIKMGPGEIPRSAETLFNVVRLSGNGYILSAADYIGNGRSTTTQAYAVKGATNQTNQDMLAASQAVSEHLGYSSSKLMLNGWSQGGLNTQWLGNALHDHAQNVDRLSAVSGPSNLKENLNYWFNDFAGEPYWLTSLVPLLIGSYQKYYGIKDLMAYAIKPEYLETSKQLYNKKIDWYNVQAPTDPSKGLLGLPAQPIDMLTGAFIEEFNSGKGAFYRQVVRNTALEGRFPEPSRFYGGGADTVVPTWSSITMPVEHQQQLGSDLATGINVSPDATHRSTFLNSLFGPENILNWFNAA
jgi:pimeloyl-ACP methyl ester carboxylesterase